MTSLFTWTDRFLTQIESVDTQHRRLIELINDLAELVMSSAEVDVARFETIREGLLAYVETHFAEEEQLMQRHGLDPRHMAHHVQQHASFIQEASRLRDLDPAHADEQLRKSMDYLVHWLAFHILDRDQSLARQIRAIQAGASPHQAYEQEERSATSSSEPLVKAMSGLFLMVSERNRELRALNQDLEARVAARTRDLEEANRRLELLSTHDDLTGLPNRRFAHLALMQVWLVRERHHDPLSVLMVDADHFKSVNDTFGHAQGDAVIVELGRRLKTHIRASDVVCRMGGDEFLVICPRNPREGARLAAEKLLQAAVPFHTEAGEACWDGSLSIGLAEATPEMAHPNDLLKAADAALYEAKRRGGRQVWG